MSSSRAAGSPSRASAFEVLRRDRQARALLDLPGASWTALLRIVLGHPDPKHAGTSIGDGVLLRLLNGETLGGLRGGLRSQDADEGGQWLAIDPTNNQWANDRYVTVAWGRDYGDVSPVKGIIFTKAKRSTLRVSVDVAPV